MTIYLTGARGFLGRHLAQHLSTDGHRVVGLGHGSWPESEFAGCGLGDWLNGDVAMANLDILSARHGLPGRIIHLAGGSSVGASLAAPAEDFGRTVTSSVAIAEWIRSRSPTTAAILASSAAVYGRDHEHPIDEKARCKPTSPYGFHKRIAEQVFQSYAVSYGLRLSVVRIFSAYGAELKKQLLWDLCSRLAGGPTHIELGGTGAETRDFVHASDVARMFSILAAAGPRAPDVVNCGTGQALTVHAVATAVVREWGVDVPIQFSQRCREGDPVHLVAAVDRARTLGFVAQTPWEQGVRDYVAWFKARRLH